MRKSAAAALLAAIVLSGRANAAMVSFYLDQSNVDQTAFPGVLPDGTNYLQLTVWDGADAVGKTINGYTAVAGDVVFELQTLPSLSQYAQNKFGLDEFAFNTKMPLTMYSASNFVGLPSNWSVGIGTQNADGFGKFELTPGANGANDVADPLFFAITGIGGDTANTYQSMPTGNAGQGAYYFAAHVINFQVPGDANNPTSAWFGGNAAVVPLPPSAWLLLSGLGASGFLRRRKPAVSSRVNALQ